MSRGGPAPGRMRSLIELLVVLLLLEALLWLPHDAASGWRVASAVALLGLVALSWHRLQPWLARDQRDERSHSKGRSWLEVIATTAALSIALATIAYLIREPCDELWVGERPPDLGAAVGIVGGEVAVAVSQQVLLMWILLPLCRERWGRWTSLLTVAVLFGLLHLPSPALTSLTALGGAVWVGLYQRQRLLAPLVASHVVLAVLAHGLLPERWSYDMRVGSGAQESIHRYQALNHPETRTLLRGICTPEYHRENSADEAYVTALYRDLLKREPEPGALEGWTSYLTGHSRAKLARRIASSREHWRLLQKPTDP